MQMQSDDVLLMEASGITIKADLIVVENDQAIASMSTPAMSNVKIIFLSFIFMFPSTKLILLG